MLLDKKTAERLKRLLELGGKRELFYHQDADGVCSAAFMLKYYKFDANVMEGPSLSTTFIDGILKKKPDLLCFLDLSIDQEWREFEALKKKLKAILIIDHHIPEKDLNAENTLYINPMLTSSVYLSTSYIIYRILEQIGIPVKENAWIACVGVIGDHAMEGCRDLIEICKKTCPVSKLEKASDMISAAITVKGAEGASKCLKLLLSSKTPDEFLSNDMIIRWYKRFEEEVENVIDDFMMRKEEFGNIMMYEIESRLNITSAIASRLIEMMPDKVIVIRKKSGSRWKISARGPEGINLNDVVKRCAEGIGKGGGHTRAAGATINNWDVFKKRFLAALQHWK